jgi:hypothetical protein
MTIMSLATHRPDVLKERAKATVLVATAATSLGGRRPRGARVANALVASPLVTRAMQSKNGHHFVRGAFGENPVRSHMDLTRDLFGGCHGAVRGDFLRSMSTMDLLEGMATMRCRPPSWWARATPDAARRRRIRSWRPFPGRDWSPCRTGGTCFRSRTPTR